MLTIKQEKVLSTIKDFIADNSYPPTVIEIQKLMGFASGNAAVHYLDILERDGYIKRSAKIARSIVVLK